MAQEYDLSKVTTETWRAACKHCGRSFRSDVRDKAVQKVLDHLPHCKKRGK